MRCANRQISCFFNACPSRLFFWSVQIPVRPKNPILFLSSYSYLSLSGYLALPTNGFVSTLIPPSDQANATNQNWPIPLTSYYSRIEAKVLCDC
ncbi:hypothetical protein M434DRAFT_397691 [Hypoxylon sp. CO27-5]|nr:hypothetical protein M434DRAFT_397691 [Hypoxylon sp. CO27-5]